MTFFSRLKTAIRADRKRLEAEIAFSNARRREALRQLEELRRG